MNWQPGDPIYMPGIKRPIAELRVDHWCGENCKGYGPASASWPEPRFEQSLTEEPRHV